MNTVVIGQNDDVKHAISELLKNKPGFDVSEVAYEKQVNKHEIGLLENADLIIIDLSATRANMRLLIMEVREIFSKAKIIALHIYKDIFLVKPIIDAGADAYLVVDSLPGEILEAIEKLSLGNKYISNEVK